MREFLHEVLLHALMDTVTVLPFLFLAFFVMEWIEHKASERAEGLILRAGRLGPLLGALLGVIPQCGFGACAAGFYAGRILTMGTLIAVFLSTSDEMLPLLISGGAPVGLILFVLAFKVALGIAVGFLVDLLLHRGGEHAHISDFCKEEECHDEKGVLYSAFRHTVGIYLFLLLTTVLINSAIFFVGEDTLRELIYDKVLIGHLVAALVGLIPNCASSVLLTTLYLDGLITLGAMLSGLLPGAGVGLLVLLRTNRVRRENLIVIGILVLVGVLAGLLVDVTGLGALVASI